MHDIAASTDSHQARQGAVVDKARVISTNGQGSQRTTHHRHQAVKRHQPRDVGNLLGAHDVKAKPTDNQDPAAQGQEWDAAGWVGRHGTFFAIPACAGPQQDHCRQCNPATDCMNHSRPCKVMKRRSKLRLESVLKTKIVVPDQPFKEGIDQPDQSDGGQQLRAKFGALCDASGDDGRNSGCKGEEEKELGELKATVGDQFVGPNQKVHAVGHAITNEEIGDGADGQVCNDLDQGIDLVLLANRADLEKGKACVHGQHHDGAQQNEQGVYSLHLVLLLPEGFLSVISRRGQRLILIRLMLRAHFSRLGRVYGLQQTPGQNLVDALPADDLGS